MNRLFLLLPVLALVGCDPTAATTPKSSSKTAVAARTDGARGTDPAPSRPTATVDPTAADPKDPPVRPPEVEERKEEPPEEAPPIPEGY